MPGFSSSSATAPARFSPGSIPNPKLGDAARSVPTDACQGRFLQILHRAQRRTADQCAVCGSDHLVNAESILQATRSEARRVGKECVSTCNFRWTPDHKKKKKKKK